MEMAPKDFTEMIRVGKACLVCHLFQFEGCVKQQMNHFIQAHLGDKVSWRCAGYAFKIMAKMTPAHGIAFGQLLHTQGLAQRT